MRGDQSLIQLQRDAETMALRGSLIFHLDLAAALGVPGLAEAGVAADLITVLVDADGYGVLAIADGGAPQERAIVRFVGDGRPQVQRRDGPARAADIARARAAATVGAARLTLSNRESIVVIPRSERAGHDDPIEAYALALADNPGDVVMGIHWYAKVSPDGGTLLSSEALSRTAMVLPARREVSPFAVEVVHFGHVPTEIHTWLSLKHAMPLAVIALDSNMLWMVDGERTTVSGPIEE